MRERGEGRERGRYERRKKVLRQRAKKERVFNPDRLILTQLIFRIKNTKQSQDRIKNRIYVSCPFGVSNTRYENDMIDLSYPVTLSWPSKCCKSEFYNH
jgi:hypothetical protein